MTFDEFIATEPNGLGSTEWREFPLFFGDEEDLLAEIAEYSVIDDFMSDMGMDDFESDFHEHFPNYRVIAIICLDTAEAFDDDYYFDSYGEFFFAIDKSSEGERVMLWTGEGDFEEFSPTFEEFRSTLFEWEPED